MKIINRIKLIYWQWVKSCCEEDIRDINEALEWLCPVAKVTALDELEELSADLNRANVRIGELSK